MVIGLGTPTPLTPPPWPEKWCLTTLIQWISGLDGEEDGVPDLEGTFCSGAHFLDVALSKTLIWYTVCIIWCYSPPSSACLFFFTVWVLPFPLAAYGRFCCFDHKPVTVSEYKALSGLHNNTTKRFHHILFCFFIFINISYCLPTYLLNVSLFKTLQPAVRAK